MGTCKYLREGPETRGNWIWDTRRTARRWWQKMLYLKRMIHTLFPSLSLSSPPVSHPFSPFSCRSNFFFLSPSQFAVCKYIKISNNNLKKRALTGRTESQQIKVGPLRADHWLTLECHARPSLMRRHQPGPSQGNGGQKHCILFFLNRDRPS